MLDYLHNNKTLENIMRIVDHPTALRTATNIVSSMVCNGHVLTKSIVRDSGNLMEWYMDNGDIIEVERVVSYRTGIPTPLRINVTHYEEGNDEDRSLCYKEVFFQSFDLTETEEKS
jgi:hypothetical protein